MKDMFLLKKVIREQLEKVLSNLNESELYKGTVATSAVIKNDPKDNIIYDYEKGRAFGENNLATDINNLNRYQLVDYLPNNPNEESWNFEFQTVYKTILLIDIKRYIRGGKSLWEIKFGQLYKGETHPTLIAELDTVVGYDSFISNTNKLLAAKIDPAKY